MASSVLRAAFTRSPLLPALLAIPVASLAGESITDQVWRSGPAGPTRAVALGDVNRDGHLDLICGNIGQPVSIYFGRADSIFSSAPVVTDSSRFTTSIAVGDVDGDGDGDLVCGNLSQPNNLYRNDAGTFRWVWASQIPDTTSCVALADVDDDGLLDLICGNQNQANMIYLNLGGYFQTTPACSVGFVTDTRSVAAGDLDGDGAVDLVFGNSGQATNVYLNQGGTFAALPTCSLAAGGDTRSVALGDIDGDGHLDLVCGGWDMPSTLYLNQGSGLFSDPPSWSSPAFATNGVALGDLDRDGLLDLVLGNEAQVNVAFLNLGAGLFGAAPACSTAGFAFTTHGITLGDLDGDGDLELVCGNFAQVNTAYGNDSDPFATTAAWIGTPQSTTSDLAVGDVTGDGLPDLVFGNNGGECFHRNAGHGPEPDAFWASTALDQTSGIALGDLDGDGSLDLVCANSKNPGEANSVYYGPGTSFPSLPTLLPGTPRRSADVAVGDVDHDGDLDLIFGNSGEIDILYRNDAGTFDSTWASAQAYGTQAVALCDVNDDGRPDLVCGSTSLAGEDAPNTLYLNQGGTFPPDPTATVGEQRNTRAVALGDVDGDADPDLVCGNFGQPNTLYLNTSGVFDPAEAWSSAPSNGTNAAALGDIDADGRLDLACANQGAFFGGSPNTVYLNDGTRFTSSPVWQSSEALTSTGVVLTDLDGDGDLDLAFANSPNASNTIHWGTRNPPYAGDALAPTNQLPNNPAHIHSLTFREVAGTDLRWLEFELVDVESDPVWLLPEYQFEGQPVWRPIQPGADPLGPFASSPAGVVDSVSWDLSTVAFDRRDVIVRIKALEAPVRTALVQRIPSYQKALGPIVSVRPEITTSAGTLAFPTMTVGDSASATLDVSNTGTLELHITDLRLSSPEMRIDPAAPLALRPGEAATLTVNLEPRVEIAASGTLALDSNDPATPTAVVNITTDVRPLAFQTRLLVPGPLAPLGEALTAVVTPEPEVEIERGALHYRARSSGGSLLFVDSLSAFGGDWIVTIPGDRVTESGLDYFVEVANGTILATDPPDTSMGLLFQGVASPSLVMVTPRATTGGEITMGSALVVQVTLPNGSEFASGTVLYRKAGAAVFDSTDVQELPPEILGVPVLGGVVPPEQVTERGVDFQVEVRTATRSLTSPLSGTRVVVTSLTEPTGGPGGRYRLVSVPLAFPELTGSIEPILADQPEFGSYDPARWRAFRYSPVLGANIELSDPRAADLVVMEPGAAFWLICRSDHRIDTAPLRGLSTSPIDPADPPELVLDPGWNMIASPFTFPVAWESVEGADAPEVGEPVAFDPSLGTLGDYASDPATVLMPFEGYFVRNISSGSQVLRFPPIAVDPVATARDTPGDVRTDSDWIFLIEAGEGPARSGTVFVGTHALAADDLDPFDREQPPAAPGWTAVVSVDDTGWAIRPGLYRRDVRSRTSTGHTWDLQVRARRPGADVTLHVVREDRITDPAVVLIDREQGLSLDVPAEADYRLVSFGPDRPYRLALVAGTRDYIEDRRRSLEVPQTLILQPNAPNPFDTATRIRFGLPGAGRATLVIYDVLGRRVTSLVDAPLLQAGYHVAIWDGRDSRGSRVAPGVYFYRLETDRGSLRRKMILLR